MAPRTTDPPLPGLPGLLSDYDEEVRQNLRRRLPRLVEDVGDAEPDVPEVPEEEEEGSDDTSDPGDVDVDERGLFDPPLYKQRYESVFEILNQDKWTAHMRKVVDFGCAESKFLAGLKRLRHCQLAIGVDIDDGLLEECKFKIEPIFADFLDPRKICELKMYQMAGSVAEYDSRLSGVDAVAAIELIEHLEPEILEKVPANIFGNLKPKVAVITTPNREFNTLFPDFEGPFRHWDHKFEWDRSQFQDWAHSIVNEYPDYSVRFLGVGDPYTEAQKESHGFCSQIAVFVSKSFEASLAGEEAPEVPKGQMSTLAELAAEAGAVLPYRVINEQTYPCRVEHRSRLEIIGDEASYYVKQMAFYTEDWDEERDVEVKISELLPFSRLQDIEATEEEIRSGLINKGYAVSEDGASVTVPYEAKPESEDEEGSEVGGFDREHYQEEFGGDEDYDVDEYWD